MMKKMLPQKQRITDAFIYIKIISPLFAVMFHFSVLLLFI